MPRITDNVYVYDSGKPRAYVKVPVLLYHEVSDENRYNYKYNVSSKRFEEHMKYLKENDYETITFDDLHKIFWGQKALSKKPVIVTFDDNYIGQYENAFSVLKKYGQKAVFFVATNHVRENGRNIPYMDYSELKELSDSGMEIASHTVNHVNLKYPCRDFPYKYRWYCKRNSLTPKQRNAIVNYELKVSK